MDIDALEVQMHQGDDNIVGVCQKYGYGDYMDFVTDDGEEKYIEVEADLGAMMIEAVRE